MRRKSRCPVWELQAPASTALVGRILPTPKSSVKGLSTTGQSFCRRGKTVYMCVCSVEADSACQAPLSFEFSRQEYWSGLPFPSPTVSHGLRIIVIGLHSASKLLCKEKSIFYEGQKYVLWKTDVSNVEKITMWNDSLLSLQLPLSPKSECFQLGFISRCWRMYVSGHVNLFIFKIFIFGCAESLLLLAGFL